MAAVIRAAATRLAQAVAMSVAAVAAAASAIAATGAAALAEACDVPADFTPRGRIEDAGIVLVYRTVPAVIQIGRHFSVDALVCAGTGSAVLAHVDAQMPEHRHGMNYRATVAAAGAARYVAEGLLFHRPGRWQLLFDVERAGRRLRLTSEVDVE